MASAASILDLFRDSRRANRITFFFGTVGRIAEIAAAKCVERSASQVPAVAAPFHTGATGVLWKTASALTAVSVAVSALPSKSRRKRKLAGVFGAAGSFVMRFAVHYVSNASARDPRASFHQQRANAGSKTI
jgi:hypothetical protein